MPFTFRYTAMPAGVGGAIYASASRQASFARRVELARLQIEKQKLELQQAEQVVQTSALDWRRRAEEQQAQERRQAAAVKQVTDRLRLGNDLAAEQRLTAELEDRLTGGPEQRRLKLALEQERAKREAQAPERLQRARVDLAKAGFRLAAAEAPAAGARVRLDNGEVWEKAEAGGGKYTPYESKQIAHLGARIQTLEKQREAELKEAEALRSEERELQGSFSEKTGRYEMPGAEGRLREIRARLGKLRNGEQFDREIEAHQGEIERLIVARMPAEERAEQEAEAGRTATVSRLNEAVAAAKSWGAGGLTPAAREALEWAGREMAKPKPDLERVAAVLAKLGIEVSGR